MATILYGTGSIFFEHDSPDFSRDLTIELLPKSFWFEMSWVTAGHIGMICLFTAGYHSHERPARIDRLAMIFQLSCIHFISLACERSDNIAIDLRYHSVRSASP